ncbi:hypothetical protein [Flavobacterium sp.]|uniref:portal protein n=1 Tax=Flavobacterium sp. TaxID=239 RepID=UPI003F69829A
MVQIAEKHTSQLNRIKKNVEDAHHYFSNNIDRYHTIRKFIFETSITEEDKQKLSNLKKPPIQFNELEAFISRLRGEFSKQIPSVNTVALSNNIPYFLVELSGQHIRYILETANKEQFSNNIYMDTLSGGFSVMKVWTDYEHEETFDEVIKVSRAYDPTLCGFDPLSTEPHKGDGEYCFELYPMTRESFEMDYPNIDLSRIKFSKSFGDFPWYYNENNTEILMLCRYYEKKYKKFTLFKLSNEQSIRSNDYEEMVEKWDSIEQIPEIVDRRESKDVKIICYKLIGDELIEKPIETKYNELPLIFVDGNSAILKNNSSSSSYQFTRPYIYHAQDAQKFKNYIGQTFAAEVENMEQHKWLVEKECIPEDYVPNWTNPQIPGILPYNGRDKDGNPLPEPRPVPRVPIPPEIYSAFNSIDSTIQNILGSYDASLGINNNQLSGVAIVEGATQSNATAMPYVMNFMASLNQLGKVILGLIPQIYFKNRMMPILGYEGMENRIQVGPDTPYPMKFNKHDLGITTESTANFKIEKNRAIQQLATLSEAFPAFKQFINEQGLPFIVSNLDIPGGSELKKQAIEFQKNQDSIREKIQQTQMNPQSQLNPQQLADLHLKAQKQQLEEQKMIADNQFRASEIALENKKLDNEQQKIGVNARESLVNSHVQLTKAETEKQSKAAELIMKEMSSLREHQLNLQKAIQEFLPRGE